jgi:hypothetical protein
MLDENVTLSHGIVFAFFASKLNIYDMLKDEPNSRLLSYPQGIHTRNPITVSPANNLLLDLAEFKLDYLKHGDNNPAILREISSMETQLTRLESQKNLNHTSTSIPKA